MFVSHRKQRMSELNSGLRERNDKAGEYIEKLCKQATPEQTPLLKTKIEAHSTSEVIDVGFASPEYGVYVHNGTYDFKHKRGTWAEEEYRQLEDWKSAQDRRGGSTTVTSPLGLMPRPFLLYGMVKAKPRLRTFYPPIS